MAVGDLVRHQRRQREREAAPQAARAEALGRHAVEHRGRGALLAGRSGGVRRRGAGVLRGAGAVLRKEGALGSTAALAMREIDRFCGEHRVAVPHLEQHALPSAENRGTRSVAEPAVSFLISPVESASTAMSVPPAPRVSNATRAASSEDAGQKPRPGPRTPSGATSP